VSHLTHFVSKQQTGSDSRWGNFVATLHAVVTARIEQHTIFHGHSPPPPIAESHQHNHKYQLEVSNAGCFAVLQRTLGRKCAAQTLRHSSTTLVFSGGFCTRSSIATSAHQFVLLQLSARRSNTPLTALRAHYVIAHLVRTRLAWPYQ